MRKRSTRLQASFSPNLGSIIFHTYSLYTNFLAISSSGQCMCHFTWVARHACALKGLPLRSRDARKKNLRTPKLEIQSKREKPGCSKAFGSLEVLCNLFKWFISGRYASGVRRQYIKMNYRIKSDKSEVGYSFCRIDSTVDVLNYSCTLLNYLYSVIVNSYMYLKYWVVTYSSGIVSGSIKTKGFL